MKHLLITGAGRGIGRHLLETFAPTVERVAIFDIDEVMNPDWVSIHRAIYN